MMIVLWNFWTVVSEHAYCRKLDGKGLVRQYAAGVYWAFRTLAQYAGSAERRRGVTFYNWSFGYYDDEE